MQNNLESYTLRYTLGIMMNKMITLRGYIYPIALLLLFIDISSFTLINLDIVSLLLCLYTVVLFRQEKAAPLIFIAVLLSLKSFLLYGHKGIFLISILTMSLLFIQAKTIIHKTATLPYIFLSLCIIFQDLVIEPCILGFEIIPSCTFYKIFANLLITAIFLKYLSKGNLGDRL